MEFSQLGYIIGISLIPFVFLYIVYRLDLYSSGSLKLSALMVVWGGLAFVGALHTNTWVLNNTAITLMLLSIAVAPVIEETLKGALILAISRKKVTYLVDGALYGAAAGIGFAVGENILYMLQNADIGILVGLTRLLTSTLMHTSTTAFLGVMAGRSKLSKRFPILLLLLGLVTAIAMHSAYNTAIYYLPGMEIITALVLSIGYYGLIWVTITRGIRKEQEWIKEHLRDDIYTTKEEIGLLTKEDDMNVGLDIIEERFGKEKRDRVKEYLMVEAKIGIKRKILESHDDNARQQEEIDVLRLKANGIKKELGMYCMVFVRSIFPMDSLDFWNDLGGRLDSEDTEDGEDTEGGGIFGTLNKMDQDNSVPEEDKAADEEHDADVDQAKDTIEEKKDDDAPGKESEKPGGLWSSLEQEE